MLAPGWINVTWGYRFKTASALPSVDALSTTIISWSMLGGNRWIDPRHARSLSRVFQLTTNMLSIKRRRVPFGTSGPVDKQGFIGST